MCVRVCGGGWGKVRGRGYLFGGMKQVILFVLLLCAQDAFIVKGFPYCFLFLALFHGVLLIAQEHS